MHTEHLNHPSEQHLVRERRRRLDTYFKTPRANTISEYPQVALTLETETGLFVLLDVNPASLVPLQRLVDTLAIYRLILCYLEPNDERREIAIEPDVARNVIKTTYGTVFASRDSPDEARDLAKLAACLHEQPVWLIYDNTTDDHSICLDEDAVDNHCREVTRRQPDTMLFAKRFAIDGSRLTETDAHVTQEVVTTYRIM